MDTYVRDQRYDLAITVYDGKGTADQAFDELRELEKQGLLKIEDAAVFTRSEKGTIKLKNKGYIAGWKGGTIGLGIGLLLGGPLGGAVVGGLIGLGRGSDRRNIRGLVNQKLGINESALAVVGEGVQWNAVQAGMDKFGGETVYTELQGETLSQLEELAKQEDVTAAAEEELDVS